ncbi:hypothetical protein DOE78_12180 [Bacillus sp. Y1]|jgi:hypothetical protein|nr:hypothetical protein [Bacillus sp. Y1]AYA76136.1 hypothetical protein DOE78_12180 [Bacillus sp. Y1]
MTMKRDTQRRMGIIRNSAELTETEKRQRVGNSARRARASMEVKISAQEVQHFVPTVTITRDSPAVRRALGRR